jgi:hypothetical protein
MNESNIDLAVLRHSIRAHHRLAETMSQALGAGQVTVGIERPIDEPAIEPGWPRPHIST